MPRSSLCGWVLKTAEICEPLIRLLQKDIIANGYVQADETTVQVLNEVGRDNRTKSYRWAYRGGGNKPSIVTIKKREEVIMRSHFCLDLRAIYKAMLSQAITGQTICRLSSLWGVMHRQEGPLLN
jgi:hypothetical protein